MGESFVEVHGGRYRDSVALALFSREVAELPGVSVASVAMGTVMNLERFAALGFELPAHTGPNDLVVAVRAEEESAVEAARDAVATWLRSGGRAHASGDRASRAVPTVRPRTVASAARRNPQATIAVVSVPGAYAFVEAMEALEAGLHTLIFSDGVSVAQEVRLKEEAARRGLLVMGPDCGTAVLGGVGFGFANAVRPGPVGVVAGACSGAQQLLCLLDAAGVGISHCVGVGGRDLTPDVGASSSLRALSLLEEDPATELIVLVGEDPGPALAAEIESHVAAFRTPVILHLLRPDSTDLTTVAAEAVLRCAGAVPDPWPRWLPEDRAPAPGPAGGLLRGLFCGRMSCGEATAVASAVLGPVTSNLRDAAVRGTFEELLTGGGHAIIDWQEERARSGRPHPIIDPTGRAERLAVELADPRTGAVLIDVVLGRGSPADPAAPVIAAIENCAREGRSVPVVVSLVGTAADEQGLDRQGRALAAAGAHVFLSNAQAARHAAGLAAGVLVPAGVGA
ncbi:FdrA family protein [Embleya sp. NPDC001921]